MTEQTVDTAKQPSPREKSDAWYPWNWPWGARIALGALLLMASPFAIRTLMISSIPAVAEPFDSEEFARYEVPTDENAFTDYDRAVKLQIDRELGRWTEAFDEVYSRVTGQEGWSAADDTFKQDVDANREVLAIWRQGTAKTSSLYVPPKLLTYETNLKTVQDLRTVVRFALAESARCNHENRLDESWEWSRGVFRCGGHLSNRGCIIQALVGAAFHAVSAKSMAMWAQQPGVTAQQLKSALSQIKADSQLYDSRSNTLKIEYLTAMNTLRSRRGLAVIVNSGSDDSGDKIAERLMRIQLWLKGEPELTVRLYRHVLANQLAEIDKPIATRRKIAGTRVTIFDSDPAVPKVHGQLDSNQLNRIVSASPYSALLLPAVLQFDAAMQRRDAKQATIEVVLAAQAYRRDHNEFPESLEQLVPQYLNTVPVDPCDPTGGKLRYRRNEATKATVWSVGPDGADQSGVIDTTQGQSPDIGFELK